MPQDLNKLIGKDANLITIRKHKYLGDSEVRMASDVKLIKVNKDTVTFRMNKNQATITTKKNEIYRVTDRKTERDTLKKITGGD